jgi:asparagine N-glycosylation enzyme membrane subunit Stt3
VCSLGVKRAERYGDVAASAVVALAALAAAWIGVSNGTFAAADTDPYGYVSLADAIAHGALRLDQRPLLQGLSWAGVEHTLAPPGWRPAAARGFIAPVYSPGLPLVMGAAQALFGRSAVFYIVPLLGALAVWMTGRLGRQVHSPIGGALAAVLLATSPTFLRQIVQPVSDLPTASWWTLCLVFATRASALAALGSGLAASAAILTRPNLVVLAGIVGAYLAWQIRNSSAGTRLVGVQRLAWFALGTVPGCVAVAAINQRLFGSPLESGYGTLPQLYAWANVLPNLDRYPRWLIETHTPFILLGLLAPASLLQRADRDRSRVEVLRVFSLVVIASYLAFNPFGREEWDYLRFILPCYPALLVLSAALLVSALRRLSKTAVIGATAAIVVAVSVAVWQARVALDSGAFTIRVSERRYVDVGRFVARAMPADAAFISSLHAGAIRYYASRLTVRFDVLLPARLDQVIAQLRSAGYHPYIALDEGEEATFRAQFSPFSDVGRLDWPPAAERFEPVHVRIYDPADRARYFDGRSIATGDMALVGKPLLRWK